MNDQVVQDIEHITSSHVTSSSSHHIHQNVSYHHHGSLVICPRITKCFQEIIMHSLNYSSFDLLANKTHQQWSTQSDHHLIMLAITSHITSIHCHKHYPTGTYIMQNLWLLENIINIQLAMTCQATCIVGKIPKELNEYIQTLQVN